MSNRNLFVLVLVLLSIVSAHSATFEYGTRFNKNELYAPLPFLHLDCNKSSEYLFLVEKRSQSFLVLKAVDSTLFVEKQYVCSTGKVRGDKNVVGDLKTPEGIYFIRDEKDKQYLAPIYGAGAFVLDYPNGFDKMKKKNGYGIWIHGTDEPERIQNSNDTKGCVVLENTDFNDVSQYVTIDQTPVVIVDEIYFRNQNFVEADKLEIVNFLQKWKKSWENQNIGTFIDCYSKQFHFDGMNYYAYKAYKNRLFKQYKDIAVDLYNIQIFKDDVNYVANFYQDYSTENYKDSGIKQLYIIKENDSFKIVREVWNENKATSE